MNTLMEWARGMSWDSFSEPDEYGLVKLNYPQPVWAVYDCDTNMIVAVSAPTGQLMTWCKTFLLNHKLTESFVEHCLEVSQATIITDMALQIEAKLATAAVA